MVRFLSPVEEKSIMFSVPNNWSHLFVMFILLSLNKKKNVLTMIYTYFSLGTPLFHSLCVCKNKFHFQEDFICGGCRVYYVCNIAQVHYWILPILYSITERSFHLFRVLCTIIDVDGTSLSSLNCTHTCNSILFVLGPINIYGLTSGF